MSAVPLKRLVISIMASSALEPRRSLLSSVATLFPVLAKRVPRLRIPLYVYLFARYFGAGVIIATAFINLLDPAYQAIGPVGMTGGWASYS